MTAEVSVLNRVGVALAADSAVTIGQPGSAKIYTSAEKLFQLSNTAPVGVMVYGNAGYLGLSWETAIKVFRHRLAQQKYDYLEEYAAAFLEFLCADADVFPTELQDTHTTELIAHLYYWIRASLGKQLDTAAEEQNGIDDSDIARIADPFVSDFVKQIKNADRLTGLSGSPVGDTRGRYGDVIRAVRAHVFGDLPITAVTKRRLFDAAVQMLTRAFFGPAQAGVVFAGFGEREYLPVIHEYKVEHAALGRPRYYKSREAIIDHQSTGYVLAFAQGDMVMGFMEGIDPRVAKYMHETTGELLQETIESIIEKVEQADPATGAQLRSFMEQETGALLQGLFDRWRERRSEVWGPVVSMVSALPKDELASMSEALVNLTKFRRRVTPDQETVGGPVDVAVITKGDGFVWVTRKHYFRGELNPRAVARYSKGDS